MAVNALTNRPVPQNSNFSRAMYVWVTSSALQDPLDTDNDQQSLLNFCGTNGVNALFLDVWRYLGGANWTNTKRDRVKLFVERAHQSGIRVYALAGSIDWGQNQDWVMKNIVEPVVAFNAMVVEGFDGFHFDIEYWTDEASYPAATSVPGICDLVKAIKRNTGLPVGLFCAFYLKDNGGATPRPSVTYDGKSAQDGEHFMDVADHIVVGAYRNTADDNAGNGQPGQKTLFQPWYDYASQSGRNAPGLYCGSETISITPSYITYFGQTKAAMEAQHTIVSAAFKTPANAVFLGQAVHSYDGWKAMP